MLSTSVSLDPALASAGVLHLQRRQGTDSSLELEIRQGDGGAHGVRLRGDAHHHTLKTLWQALGIPVWVRRIVPHVYVDGELVQIVGYTPDEGRYRQLLALASPPFESAGL